MIYEWLISQEQKLIPYDIDTPKGHVIRFFLRYVYGRRYWKEVVHLQRSAIKQFKASLKESGVSSKVIAKAINLSRRQT